MPTILQLPLIRDALRDPADRSPLKALDSAAALFEGGRHYPCMDEKPILIDEASSLFSIIDVQALLATTQDCDYRDARKLRNYVRQNVLPSLTWDRSPSERIAHVAARTKGLPVLVLGSGDRGDEYRACFPGSPVVVSDVHLQFAADCVIDAHCIPFADRFFGAVVAAQVLEHTSRPWLAAAEMERVARIGGVIHIEVPFGFPYHGEPYDFFRFTPTALRFLFSRSSVLALDTTEGRFSSAAVFLSAGVIDSFEGRRMRQLALAATRMSLWWMKYLDYRRGPRPFSSPKGLYISVCVDGVRRPDHEMLKEVESLLGA